MITINEIKENIYNAFKHELEKKRHPSYVNKVIIKSRSKDYLVEKLAKELLKRNLDLRVDDYINAQFIALNYMPYLPKIEQITSLNGFERWEKYKNLYKYIEAKINYKKVKKRRSKQSSYNDEELLSFKEVNDFEEDDKKRFLNQIEGFDLCLSNEIYFNPKSYICRQCIFYSRNIRS